jgi:hypothetical protein
MEAGAFGFGFRAMASRNHAIERPAPLADVLERFFGSLDSYSFVPNEFETSAAGEVGMAWGTITETWQHKGQVPEQARVRFSMVFTKAEQGYQVLLYQRDIQPFADQGFYPKSLTADS